jgi:acyl-CoA synthetase (NDP forming)
MVEAMAAWRGVEPPNRIALALDELDATPVVTMLARRDGRTAVAAASCQVSLAGGMYQVADGVLSGLEPIELASSPNLSD